MMEDLNTGLSQCTEPGKVWKKTANHFLPLQLCLPRPKTMYRVIAYVIELWYPSVMQLYKSYLDTCSMLLRKYSMTFQTSEKSGMAYIHSE